MGIGYDVSTGNSSCISLEIGISCSCVEQSKVSKVSGMEGLYFIRSCCRGENHLDIVSNGLTICEWKVP